MTLLAHEDAVALRPGEGECVVFGGNTRCTFKVAGPYRPAKRSANNATVLA